MNRLFLWAALLLSVSAFGHSDLVGRAVKVERCQGTLELRSYPVRTVQDFDKRYFLKFVHTGKCGYMAITVDKEIQILNLKKGTVLNFSNRMMKAYLDNDGDNIININFFSNEVTRPHLPVYTIINDVLDLKN